MSARRTINSYWLFFLLTYFVVLINNMLTSQLMATHHQHAAPHASEPTAVSNSGGPSDEANSLPSTVYQSSMAAPSPAPPLAMAGAPALQGLQETVASTAPPNPKKRNVPAATSSSAISSADRASPNNPKKGKLPAAARKPKPTTKRKSEGNKKASTKLIVDVWNLETVI